jgi:two-component system, sensor histidine kinase LadS
LLAINFLTRVSLLLLVLSSIPALASNDDLLPRFNMSTIATQNLSPKLHFYPLLDSLQSLPSNRDDILKLLSKLPKQSYSTNLGRRYLTALQIHNDTSTISWFLQTNGSMLEQIELISFTDTGPKPNKNEAITGQHNISNIALQRGAHIDLLPGATTTLILVMQGDNFLAPIRVSMHAYQQSMARFNLENLVLLLCLGALLTIACYNYFLFSVIRQPQYLSFATATLAFAMEWACLFAVPEWLGFNVSHTLLLPSVSVGTFSLCIFIYQFLRLETRAPKIRQVFKAISLLALVTLFVAFSSSKLSQQLISLLLTMTLLLGLVFGIQSWCRGFKPASYFSVALLIVLAANLGCHLVNINWLPSGEFNYYLYAVVANTLGCFLVVCAIAARIRLIYRQNIRLTSSLEKTVEQRTQELTSANTQLALTNSELYAANLAKDRFLANVSHEIRTPLTSIIGYAEGILLGDIDKSEQQRVTKIIAENGNHLLEVINDILDISKIEANKLEFEPLPTPLFTILGQIETLVSKRTRDKGLAFHLDYKLPLPTQIYTDPTRLKQILFNLTNNAIKFTEQGFVGITVAHDEETLIIQVKDSGVGITSEQLPRLFDPFSQADNSINRRFGGTGLGLSISRRLAQGLGGDISVESVIRKGSTFTLRIGLQVVENCEWLHSVAEIWPMSNSRVEKESRLPNFLGCSILLADDHPSNRELTAILLKKMNILVTEVENGQQVLDAVFYQNFDLILLDIHMPLLDGTEALKQIRSAGNSTPIIALTANSMIHEVQHYLRLGFSDHLAKPLSRQQLLMKLSQYLKQSKRPNHGFADEDMLKLCRDYQQELSEQCQQLEFAWQNRELTSVSDIAHKIKGSAPSFGFDVIGDKFADIEHYALQDDEIALAYELPKVLAITHQCLSLPGVDIALGIKHQRNSIAELHKAIFIYVQGLPDKLSLLKDFISADHYQEAAIHVLTIQQNVNECALFDSKTACEKLLQLLSYPLEQKQLCTPLITQLERHAQQLSTALNANLLEEY